MASIQDIRNKIKLWLQDDAVFYSLLIVIVGLICFSLGRWSVHDEQGLSGLLTQVNQPAAVSFTPPPATQAIVSATPTPEAVMTNGASGTYVASKNGTKYHLLTCPGAKQIAEQNKIYFATKAEAESSGYTPSANCKGI